MLYHQRTVLMQGLAAKCKISVLTVAEEIQLMQTSEPVTAAGKCLEKDQEDAAKAALLGANEAMKNAGKGAFEAAAKARAEDGGKAAEEAAKSASARHNR